ncbi:unnamed protein product [Schistosoma rodhaini]|uniref:Peptidase M13 C-terminal domain-containing protein n=1 Tax=Schistosoma rodhaini TaxID=6188 RepID=A0AA85FMU3_9TREM|nr:unnamed protein product [Schistosoma rodhaini]
MSKQENKRFVQYGILIISSLVIISGCSFIIYFVLTKTGEPKNLATYLTNDTTNSTISSACHDFYHFACGEWEKRNPLISQDASRTTFDAMRMKTNYYFWKIIADESYEIEDSHLQNARKFYKSCVFNRDLKTTKLTYQLLIRDLFGGWKLIPSISTDTEVTDLTDLFLSILSHTGSSHLFSLNIEEKIFAINISPGRIVFDSGSEWTSIDEFEVIYNKIAFAMGVPYSKQSEIKDAFLMMIDLSNKIPIPKGIHLSELNGIISIEELQLICPQINWDYLFEKLLQETGYEKYNQLSIIIEKRYQLKYRCEKYGDIMKRGDKGTLRTMIIMEFLVQQVLHALTFYTNGTDSNSNSSSQPHFDELCISQLQNAFPWTLERHYIRSHVNETHKTEVINMFNEIKVTVIDLLSKIDWLNEKDKAFMQDKISKLSIFALYSDQKTSQEKENLSTVFQYPMRVDNYYLNEFYIRKAKYIDTLKTRLFNYNPSPLESPIFINRAYYNGRENRIYVNAGIFQFPFYNENGSLASKYGALGWAISHEIMHAIGIKGVLVDASGTRLSGLSGLILSAEIETKTSCFSNQYRFYKFTNYKALQTDTREEILADIDGLKASYYTYRRLYDKYSNSVKQDSNISLISDQLFFLSFAQSMCGHHHGINLLIHSVIIPHVMERYRVIGALVNSKEFAHAYGCPVGSPMNPETKCAVR